METLPLELVRRTMGEVSLSDLKALRLVNKRCAALATPLLFSVLKFYGPGHTDAFSFDNQFRPKKTVEFGRLKKAVAEVLPFAGGSRKLVFAPAFYREGLWDDYRAYLRTQIDEPVDEADLSYPSDDESEYDHDAMHQAAIDRRLARMENERVRVAEAEEQWNRMRNEQIANEDVIASTLQDLFNHMTALKEIEILPWEFGEFGGLNFMSYELDTYLNGSSPVVHLLHTIATGLHATGRHVEKLHIHACVPELLQISPEMLHTFSNLRHLRLDMHQVDSLLEDAPANQVLPELFKHAQPTLERLELVSGGKWPQLPSRGAHSLAKILTDEQTNTPISFPNLRYFHLGSLLVNTTSLVDFLAAQPKILNLEFSYLYLVTPGRGWSWLATSLPETVETWVVSGQLGHEPIAGFQTPIAYNWCAKWFPEQDPLSTQTGWKGESSSANRTEFRRIRSPQQ